MTSFAARCALSAILGNGQIATEELADEGLIVDIRRGLTEFDEKMLALACDIDTDVHVLLTKADKLKRGAAKQALATAERQLPEGVTAQLFSATKKIGLDAARERLNSLLSPGQKKPRQEAGE